jgi:hypothetical protein
MLCSSPLSVALTTHTTLDPRDFEADFDVAQQQSAPRTAKKSDDLNRKPRHEIIIPTGGSKNAQPWVYMTKDEERELQDQLARLQQEHRDLDAAISALQHTFGSDQLQIQRLKKRKLQLRDRISFIEDQLTPDIIA